MTGGPELRGIDPVEDAVGDPKDTPVLWSQLRYCRHRQTGICSKSDKNIQVIVGLEALLYYNVYPKSAMKKSNVLHGFEKKNSRPEWNKTALDNDRVKQCTWI